AMTVADAGCSLAGEGLAADPAVESDIEALGNDPVAPVTTTPAKLVAGLLARQAADAGPITLLPCDNLPENGAVVRQVVRECAQRVYPELLAWLDENVEIAAALVDRVAPA